MAERRTFSLRETLVSFINIVLGIVAILLGLRFILRLFGANPAAGFVNWTYETTQPLLQPFIGAFPSPVLEGGFVIEFTTLFALIVYGLIAFLIVELINFIARAAKTRTHHE